MLVEITIRPYQETDSLQIIQLNTLEYKVDLKFISSLSTVEKFALADWWSSPEVFSWYLQLLHSANGGIIVAQNASGTIIGHLDYLLENSFHRNTLHIFWLITHPDYRNKGVAKQLIQHVQGIAKENNTTKLLVEAEDSRSDALYRSLGVIDRYLSNWYYDYEWYLQNLANTFVLPEYIQVEEVKELSYQYIQNWFRVVGEYDTPSFDFHLLQKSKGSIVEQIIWGDRVVESVYKYSFGKLKFLVICTQYLRVYSNEPAIDYTFFGAIIQDALMKTFIHDYIGVNLQIYDSKEFRETLESIGFVEEEETMDPLYDLSV